MRSTISQVRQESHAHRGKITSCAWSPLHDRVVTAGEDDCITIWDGVTGKILRAIRKPILGGRIFWSRPYQYELAACAWSPREDKFVCAVKFLPWAYDNDSVGAHVLMIRDGRSGRIWKELKGHTDHVRCCAWSPDGERIVSIGDDHRAIVWNGRSGRIEYTYADGFVGPSACAWSPDGMRLALVTASGQWRIWNSGTGETFFKGTIEFGMTSCAWSPEGDRLLTGCENGHLLLLAGIENLVLKSVKIHEGRMASCAGLAGDSALSAGADGRIRMTDLATLEIRDIYCGAGAFTAMDVSADRRNFVAAGVTGDLYFFRLT